MTIELAFVQNSVAGMDIMNGFDGRAKKRIAGKPTIFCALENSFESISGSPEVYESFVVVVIRSSFSWVKKPLLGSSSLRRGLPGLAVNSYKILDVPLGLAFSVDLVYPCAMVVVIS